MVLRYIKISLVENKQLHFKNHKAIEVFDTTIINLIFILIGEINNNILVLQCVVFQNCSVSNVSFRNIKKAIIVNLVVFGRK